jgi:flagellar hook-associated protein 3 FlgL
MKGMSYRTQVTEVEQFKRNLSEAYNWMETTDAALDQGTQALMRIRELATQAANDTYSPGERENIAKEVTQLREHLFSISNTKNGNKYVFNGTDTTNAPNGVFTNNNPVAIELDKGIEVQVNIDPSRVFGNGLFDDIADFEQALLNEELSGEDFTEHLENMFGHINTFVSERAEVGARVNRVEMMENRLMNQEVSAKKIMSNNEDADFEVVIMDLMMQENVHRALMDFLR